MKALIPWLAFIVVYGGGIYCFYRALDAMDREQWSEAIFWMLVILTTAVGRIGMIVEQWIDRDNLRRRLP